MSYETAEKIARLHSAQIRKAKNGHILFLDIGTQRNEDGTTSPYEEWVEIPCTKKAILEILGY